MGALAGPARNLLVETLLGPGRQTPDKACVVTATSTMTYGQLDALSAQLAHALAARGVGEGDRVVVQIPKSPASLALNIACARLGALYVPLNTAYTEREVLGLVADAGATLVVRASALGPVTRVDPSELLAQAAERPTTFEDVATDAATPAALLFTSGTTGRPKGAVLTQGNLVFGCTTLNELWAICADDVVVHVLPLFHLHGLFVAAYCSLASGASMRFFEHFDVGELLAAFETSTLMMGVPTHYSRLLADPRLGREGVAAMRLFVSGSAPLLASTHEAFAARTGHAILERYGMTETGVIASNPLVGARKPGRVGRALPGVELRVEGSPGPIQVRGPNVFAGYWGRPELRASEFTPDGYFLTGDLGLVDEDGYLEIVGRAKDVVITGGLNVYPREVESLLELLPGVVDSAVVGVPDDDFGEVVAAALVVGGDFDAVAAMAQLRVWLAPFKVPRRVVVVEELPRNTMGKVQRNAVRDLILNDAATGASR